MVSSPITCSSGRHWVSTPPGMKHPQHKKTAGTFRPLERGFFLYFAHHAMPGPLGAKATDLAKYRGHYDAGWDEARRRRHARQLAQGLFPAGTPLPDQERHPAFAVPAWQALTGPEQARYAR